MADPNQRPTEGEPPSHVHVEGEKKSMAWLWWLLAALLLAALIFGLTQCDREETAVVPPVAPIETEDADRVVATTPEGLAALDPYLAGAEATPRTFVFDQLNFDTASSDIRAADRAELRALAATLEQYPESRIRIVGFADARGSGAANATLGADRANGVKAALVDQGVDARRIGTASGGESNPVETNANAPGRAENRRTELVVTAR